MKKSSQTVLVEYFLTKNKLYLIAARRDLARPAIISIDKTVEDIRQLVYRLYEDQSGQDSDQAKGFCQNIWNVDEDYLQNIMGDLVAPILNLAPSGDLIILVPHNILHYLPLHAAKVRGQHLIDRNPICYAPSAGVLRYCRAQRKSTRRKVIVFGDSCNDLPYAREEALLVARLFGVRPYIGGQATKESLKNLVFTAEEGLDVLHIACHVIFNSSLPLKSGIQLNGKRSQENSARANVEPRITAEDILRMRLDANLVTLSGCASGMSYRMAGDELMGLVRAFVYAGASSVLASLWPVDDYSTYILMQRFYEEISDHIPDSMGKRITKARALQKAQKHVKNMTVAEAADYYEREIERLSAPKDKGRKLRFRLGQAKLHILSGDLTTAQSLCRYVKSEVGDLPENDRVSIGALLHEALRSAEQQVFARSGAPRHQGVAKPFSHPYHWAPFMLIGDWE